MEETAEITTGDGKRKMPFYTSFWLNSKNPLATAKQEYDFATGFIGDIKTNLSHDQVSALLFEECLTPHQRYGSGDGCLYDGKAIVSLCPLIRSTN